MEFKLESFHRNVSDEDLLEDIRIVAAQVAGTLSYRNYEDKGRYTAGTISRRFGSWNAALTAAGIKPGFIRDVSDELLFENLEVVWIRLGRQPKSRDMIAPLSNFSSNTYLSRFGSWRIALEKFVETVNSRNDDIQLADEIKSSKEETITNSTEYKHKTKREVNWRLRFQVFARDKFKCVACGRSPAKDPEVELHADHIIPWSKHGETLIDNLQTLCSICNLGKSNIEV